MIDKVGDEVVIEARVIAILFLVGGWLAGSKEETMAGIIRA